MIEVGDQLQLRYPVRTHVRFWTESPTQQRDLTIVSVRDLVREPLTAAEFLRRPFVARSRYLIRAREGFDWRQFYLGSSVEFRSPSTMRLAIFDPDEPKKLKRICREFQPTVEDRAIMVRLIKLWESEDHGDFELKIVCDDLRLVS